MATRTCPTCGAPDYGSPFCVSCQRPFPRPGPGAAVPPGITGPAADVPAIRPAGFFRRAFAFFIDWLLLSVVGDILHVVYSVGSGKGEAAMNFNTLLVISTVIALLYFTFFIGDGGQTLGKKLVGIRVILTDGKSVSYDRAFTRSLGYFLSAFFGTFLGFLWALWDRRNQTWHDKIAGTIVVRT